jgi:hypothetical protein
MESRPEDMVDAGDKVIELRSLVADLTEVPDVLPEVVPESASDMLEATEDFLLIGRLSGCSSDTIFIPTEVPVEAGMKRVVIPRFLITVRCGWNDAQHGELVSPVE